MAFGFLRFLFKADCFAALVEFHDSVALRIADLITENACAALDRERFTEKIEFPVKDVVAQNQAGAGVANEFGADQKASAMPFGFGCSAYWILIPSWEPSPRKSRSMGKSFGVEMIRTSRRPPSMRVASG